MPAPAEETEVFRMPVPAAASFTQLIYPLRSDSQRSATAFALPTLAPLADPGRMRDAGYCDFADIERLWAQKNRLDSLFDRGESASYWRAREELYPAGRRGSKRSLGNRAGEKIEEIARAVGGLEDALRPAPSKTSFLDICGAPGAWTRYLLQLGEAHGALMCGFGLSLRDGTNPRTCTWYDSLVGRTDFCALWGADGTGNVCSADNIAHAAASIGGCGTATIVVADGGFGVGPGQGGKHLENYQEVFCGHILLAEVLLMLETIREDGHFVCKLFDTFSHLTCGLIFLVSYLFSVTFVVKPRHSRVVNSERYLVGKHFHGKCGCDALRAAVRAAHAAWPPPGAACTWDATVGIVAPVSVVPPSLIAEDELFLHALRTMASTLCRRQVSALQAVINRAEELLLCSDLRGEQSEKRQRLSNGMPAAVPGR